MPHGGNVNIMTVMGDARMDGLSDAGSTPAISTINLKPRLHGGALSLYMDIKGVERER